MLARLCYMLVGLGLIRMEVQSLVATWQRAVERMLAGLDPLETEVQPQVEVWQ